MALDTVRISRQGREQLSWLKRHTGIENWNVLCRWALCVSLAEQTRPPAIKQTGEGGVEMAWKTFGGAYGEIYLALLKDRCRRDGLGVAPETIAEQLRLHIHRGLGYLAANRKLRSIADLLRLVLASDPDAGSAAKPGTGSRKRAG